MAKPTHGSSWITGRFGRMFPNLSPLYIPSPPLIELGKKGGPMDQKEDSDDILNKTIPTGFTYFGQFLDHNITMDTTGLPLATEDPTTTRDFRTGKVDLEHVYGVGPQANAFHLYDLNDVGKFYIDSTQAAYTNDVPRNAQEVPVIPEPRNDNNVIVIQIHLAFMKFHNNIVDYLKGQGVSGDKLFSDAQQLAQWHYQWIVLNEWLRLVIPANILDDILTNGPKFFKPAGVPFMPVEFAAAAYRFHPLVRQGYKLNDQTSGSLFHFRNPYTRITPALVIDWKNLFDFGESDSKPDFARLFQPKVADTFLNMPGPIDNPLNWPMDVPTDANLRSIAVRNLIRGVMVGLPSGEDVARRMSADVLTSDEVGLKGLGFDFPGTPLWYYVLAEAKAQQKGQTLGQVGGRIVAEVFYNLINKDPASYLSLHPHWTPTLPSAKAGTFTMVDMLKFAGVA